MENEKRQSRSYKAKAVYYFAAIRKAHKNKTTLAKEIEKFVIKYSGVKEKK